MLLERLRKDFQKARLARAPHATLLGTLIGAADNAAKTGKSPKELTDPQVIAMIRTFLNGADETIAALAPKVGASIQAGEAHAHALAEREFLAGYLPRQLTADEITEIARKAIAEGAGLGQVMARLKADHAGAFDGQMASGIVRDLLAA